MLLDRSDLNISEEIRHTFSQFWIFGKIQNFAACEKV